MSPVLELGFSLGSNLGDKVEHLRKAARMILDYPDCSLIGKSSLYETEPVDVKEEYQHLTFVNSVLIIATTASAKNWLQRISEIETALGRRRDGDDKNAPRPVDVDIIFAGDQLIGSGGLVVPHPRWAERRFVVEPLAELQPNRQLPGISQTVSEVLALLPKEGGFVRLPDSW